MVHVNYCDNDSYLVKISEITSIGIRGSFQNTRTGHYYDSKAIFNWTRMSSIVETTDTFPKPKLYLNDLKPGDKFNLKIRSGYVFTLLSSYNPLRVRNGAEYRDVTYVYSGENNDLCCGNDNLEVVKIEN